MFRSQIKRHFVAVLLAVVALPAAGLDSDRDQPAELSANHAEMNNATGIGIYTGDVVLIQGTMRLTADKMTVYTTANGDLQRVVAEGQDDRNATFRQLPEGQLHYVHAEAPYMEYQPAEPGHVLLKKGAVMTQGPNEFKGETIHYDMQKDTVIAESSEGGGRRVHITFFPEKKEAEQPSKNTTTP